MQKIFFRYFSVILTGLILPFFLSACIQWDFMEDLFRDRNAPLPENSPYQRSSDEKKLQQFQAKTVDRMVTNFSMALVMNGCSGKKISKTVSGGSPKGSPEEKTALSFGKKAEIKLLHTGLLFRDKYAKNFLQSTVKKDLWILAFHSGEKVIFSCTEKFPPPPQKTSTANTAP